MAQRLPSGFTALRDALPAGEQGCFLGVVVQIQRPIRLQQDWVCNFTIRDRFPGDDQDVLSCRICRRLADHIPNGDPGDVAILRYLKPEIHNSKIVFINSLRQSEVTFFPVKSIPSPEVSVGYQSGGLSKLPFRGMPGNKAPDSTEQMAIINMKAAAAPLLADLQKPGAAFRARLPPGKSNFTSKKKQSLISDMTYSQFYDLVGEVVKTFWVNDAIDIYVTDYTTNKELYLYEDPEETDNMGWSVQGKPWPGPFGQMTIAIRLYGPHAAAARSIQEGDFVFLQNVRTKMSQANKLEGAIHQDPKYPGKICIRECTNETQLEPVKKRKEDYERDYQSRKIARAEPQPSNIAKKPSAKASARKKESKKEKQRIQKEKEQAEIQKKAEEDEIVASGLNKNIRAGHQSDVAALSTADDIVANSFLKTITPTGKSLTLPFVNSKYRARLRIVDHYPFKLESFTRISGDSTSGKFVWHFFLLVEDADAPAGTTPTRFPLTIDTPRAQNLIQMDPIDFSKQSDMLKKLENKLFLLWGNLHERKVALKKEGINLPLPVGDKRLGLSNRPFECCIEEYGVPVDDKGVPYAEKDDIPKDVLGNPKTWKRTWSPFNTTIVD